MLNYDKYIVAFSGGKDSTACFLRLLDLGIPKEKIELWHHDIDGQGSLFMDWECTRDYCKKFAQAYNIPIYYSWRAGGFLQEMLRDGTQASGDTIYENEHGRHRLKSTMTKTVRRKFPQIGSMQSGRWCSPKLKIDIARRIFNNDKRFVGQRTAIITGERGEESSNRAKLLQIEPHESDSKNRYIDQVRLIRDWSEAEVWEIIKKYKVRAHPAYYLGWGRVSCKYCIFGNANQFASAYAISPIQGDKMIALEKEFGHTMKRKKDLATVIKEGVPYDTMNEFMTEVAKSYQYKLSIFTNHWTLPAGAFGDSCGPS